MTANERASFIHDPNLRVLIDSDRLQERVRELGREITRDYAGKNLHLLGVLKDIIDTGLTLNYMVNIFRAREVKSLAIAALLDKPERHEIEIEARYIGFTIPNHFVVGYGLDVGEVYRNLPFIAVPQNPEELVKN